MARKNHEPIEEDRDPFSADNLSVSDRPTVGQVIVIVRRMQLEDRLHRRIRRRLQQWRRFDWAAWRFRMRMRLHRWQNTDCSRTMQREVNRVAALVQELNKDVPREQQLRGKIYVPRGLFAIRKVDVPDYIDIVWPKARRQP